MKAKYKVLFDEIYEKIIAGEYKPGEKLPSENELSAVYSLSRQTVRQALALLETGGLITRRQGSGSIVNPLQKVSDCNPSSSNTIAVVSTYIGEYIFPDILQAIEEVLGGENYRMMVFATRNRVETERRVLMDLLKQPLAGIILEGAKTALPNPNIDLYRALMGLGIPIVFLHATFPELSDNIVVRADDVGGGTVATKYLISRGHKRIAGIFKSDDIQGHHRYVGYISAMRAAGLPIVNDNILWYTTETIDTIPSRVAAVLDSCTAVVCYNDEVAISVIATLKKEGRSVPDDISVVGFDNSTYGDLCSPAITSCCQNKRQYGILAAQKILALLKGVPQESSALQWHIVEKESVQEI